MDVSSSPLTRRRSAPDEPVGGRTLTDDAYRTVRWGIITLQLEPGASFTEAELSERLALSRTPLREALLLLRTEGLVTVGGRSGHRVSPITLRDVHDVALLLRVLEGEAASLAATVLMRIDQLTSLSERVPHLPQPSNQSAVLNWIESDSRFHIALAAATGNSLLVNALEPVLGKYSRLVHLALMLGTPAASLIHTHEPLMDALKQRDGQSARNAAVTQIAESEEIISRALIRSPSLLTTNVFVEKPANAFYLDVKPDELAQQDRRDDSRKAPRIRPNSRSRQGVET